MATTTLINRVWAAAINSGVAVGGSGWQTGTFDVAGAAARIPFGVQFSNVSALDPYALFYRSCDNCGTYDTTPLQSLNIGRVATNKGRNSIELPVGSYMYAFLNPGPNTCTLDIGTYETLYFQNQ